MTTLKYVQPASPMVSPSRINTGIRADGQRKQSQEQGGLVTTTVKDYDLSETGKAMRGLFMVRRPTIRVIGKHTHRA